MAPAAVSRIETAEQAARARAGLTTAFASDPFTRWIFADPGQFLSLFPHVLTHMGGLGRADGVGFVTSDGCAASLWLPPGAGPDLESLGPALSELVLPEEAPEVMGEMAARHPEEPHWYLPFIGVDPGAQGRGLGSALLAQSLALVDADHLPAYLESTNPRNVPLYERFGFRVIGEIQAGSSPPMHPMWREAR
jgi:GNAT superfamily N-acetyltransferase